MVNIITGKMNSGKTTKLLDLYNDIKKGNGIISRKKMIGSSVFGFFAYVLETKEEFPYMIHQKQMKEETASFIYQIGPYLVYKKTQLFIEQFYIELIDNRISPLYFDEVGKLELSNRGFYSSIKYALDKNIDIYMTIREDLVDSILKHFNILDYQIVSR